MPVTVRKLKFKYVCNTWADMILHLRGPLDRASGTFSLYGKEIHSDTIAFRMPMVWASNGYWYVGKRDELGKQAGWMQVRDSASLPEEITGTWQV